MASGNYDIICEQGTTFRLNVNYYDNAGQAYNLVPNDAPSKYWLRMDIRTSLYESNTSSSGLIVRFATENDFNYTGTIAAGTTGNILAGHVSLNGQILDVTGGTYAASGVTGQISLFLSHHITEQVPSGSYLFDMFLYEDTGILGGDVGDVGTTGGTADAIAHKLLQGKFIVIPSVTEPSA